MIQTIELNLIPNGIPAVIYGSQWDQKRKFKCKIYEGTEQFTITSGMDITINGRKPDGTIFLYTRDDGVLDWQTNTNVVTITTALQISGAVGETECQLRFTDSNGSDLGTVNFTIEVSDMPADDEDAVSQTELPSIIAQAKAQEAACRQYAEDSRGYYEGAQTAANNAEAAAVRSQTSAAEAKDSEDNAKASEEAAALSAQMAQEASSNPPYIGQNGNWWIFDTTTGQYVDSGVDASVTVTIADITMLEPTETPYVTNTGTNTDPIFHLFIPRGVGISAITKTGTSGLVDTYTITYSDGNTTTFTVTNGKSAYESAVEGGYTKTEAQFYEDLASFEGWKDDAEAAADLAEQYAQDAKDEADRAEFYADFVTPHFIIEDNRLWLKDDAALEFITANNRLYVKTAA